MGTMVVLAVCGSLYRGESVWWFTDMRCHSTERFVLLGTSGPEAYLGVSSRARITGSNAAHAPSGGRHVEDGLYNESEAFKPWVWILALLFGSMAVSMSMQFYHYVSVRIHSPGFGCVVAGKTWRRGADTSWVDLQTQVVARTQAILTQLMFDHALKMRSKASTSNSADKKAAPGRPQDGKGGMPAITNLVTTDLTNVTNASTFVLLVCEYFGFDRYLCRTAADWYDGSARDSHPSRLVCGFLVFHSRLEVRIIFNTDDRRQSLIYVTHTSTFVGVAVMVALFPVPTELSKRTKGLQGAKAKAVSDARLYSWLTRVLTLYPD